MADLLEPPLPKREQQVTERFYLLGWDTLTIDGNAVDSASAVARAAARGAD